MGGQSDETRDGDSVISLLEKILERPLTKEEKDGLNIQLDIELINETFKMLCMIFQDKPHEPKPNVILNSEEHDKLINLFK